jgi:hypothetical protein
VRSGEIPALRKDYVGKNRTRERRGHVADDPRSCRRFQAAGAALLKTLGDASRDLNVALVDIGYGGIGVLAKESVDKGLRVAIELVGIPPPNGRTALGEGEVVNARSKNGRDEFRVGIRFTKVDVSTIQHVIQGIQAQRLAQRRGQERGRGPTGGAKHGWF